MVEMIRGSRFTPVRLRTGYRMGEVDQMLDDAERAVVSREPLAPVLRRELPRDSLRETYAIGDVDAFIESLLHGAEGAAYEAARQVDPNADLSFEQRRIIDLIDGARFRSRMFKGGYPVPAVDRMLDAAVDAVRERRSLEPVVGARIEQVRRGRSYDAAEVDAFVARLLEETSGRRLRRS